jgi:hypothetical protein
MAFRMLQAASVAVSLVGMANAAITRTGSTANVNGISYYIGTEAVATIESKSTGSEFVPLTVMKNSNGTFTTSSFRSLVASYSASDDVFNTGFLQGTSVLLPLSRSITNLNSHTSNWYKQLDFSWCSMYRVWYISLHY